MRAAATYMLLLQLLAALLVGVTACNPQQDRDRTPLQQVVQNPDSIQQQQVGNESKESLKDDYDDGPFIASEETEEGELWASDDDPDWTPSESDEEERLFISSEETEEVDLWAPDDDPEWTPSESQEEESSSGSFIASEETEEEELWASDDDPDWTPSESQEEESYEGYDSQEDDQSRESGESQEHVIPQQGVEPLPEVTFPPVPLYAQWGNHVDYGSDLQQQSNTQTVFLVRGKRYVKQSYQSSQQVGQVSAPYESQQGGMDSEIWGSNEDGRRGYQGKEPVLASGGPKQYETGQRRKPEKRSEA